MKRLIILSLLLIAFAHASAEFVNQDQAQAIAAGFFSNQEARAVRQAGNIPQVRPRLAYAGASGEENLPAYYIFNSEDGSAFVIVSAESSTRPILAYSNEGAFHVDQMEHGAWDFLKSYEQAIHAVRYSGAQPTATKSAEYEAKLLSTALFDQTGYSFNSKYAPKIDNQDCLSGCVATAMSIIMKYHNWPTRNTGKHSYTSASGMELSCDFSSIQFAWDKMTDTPNQSSSDGVSELQRACGIAINMEYGVDMSWAYFVLVNYALRHYFYYDYPFHLLRSEYDDEEWDSIMRAEIDSNRPVFIGGQAASGGHAYVLDGYDSDGVFHYNLGWGGINNGYYTEGFVSDECYANTDALIGIQPRSMEEEDFSSPLQYSRAGIDIKGDLEGNYVFLFEANNLMNISNTPFTGRTRVDIYDKDFNHKYTVQSGYDESSAPLLISYYYFSYLFPRCYIPKDAVLAPTDIVTVSTSTDNGKTWKPVYCASDCFNINRVGGHGSSAVMISQLAYYSEEYNLEFNPSEIAPGYNISMEASNLYNYSEASFNGSIGVALCDTTDWHVVRYFDGGNASLVQSSGYDLYVVNGISIPQITELKPTYALTFVTKSNDSDKYGLVTTYMNQKVFVMLSDYFDIADGINAVQAGFQAGTAVIYSTDGKAVATFQAQQDGIVPTDIGLNAGIYVIRYTGGKTSLVLIK